MVSHQARKQKQARQLRCELLEVRDLLAGAWSSLAEIPASPTGARSYLGVEQYAAWQLSDDSALRAELAGAPLEFTAAAPLEFSLPGPNGEFARFALVESPLMAPELAALFPEIKTYAGQGIDDPAATVRLDLTPQGFHAQVLSPTGDYYVDPYYHLETTIYVSYYTVGVAAETRLALMGGNPLQAEQVHLLGVTKMGPQTLEEASATLQPPFTTEEESQASLRAAAKGSTTTRAKGGSGSTSGNVNPPQARPSGSVLRTYRAAVAATAEYTSFHGGTVPLGQAAVVTAVNRVTGVYEKELSIRLTLIANNNLLIYTNSATDPYTNNDPQALLTQNQTTIDGRIGSANYDIGHVFSTGGGGLAAAGVGVAGFKAQGETGSASPIGDSFYIDYVAHEMGHQFNANHSWAGVDGSCSTDNYYPGTGVEPGSGTTLMSYAGLCNTDDLAGNADAVFHARNAEEIIGYVDDDIPAVGTRTNTGNAIPTVSAGSDFAIPLGTPFTLTATGSDANSSDVLTYSWEQYNGLGPQRSLAAADNGVTAWFRSRPPTNSPDRTFPRLSDLLSNSTVAGEALPTVAKTMDFRVTVRDNRTGGAALNTDDMRLDLVNTGAAFKVTQPNQSSVHWTANSTQLVTWNVAGTTGNGINTAQVNIRLSTDGGLTFPILLAGATSNDGVQLVEVPSSVSTSSARVRVEPVGNIYFDVSDADFFVDAATTTFDFGDAPNTYGTTLASDGARHTRGALRLGSFVEADLTGQTPPGLADGAEEDGVVFLSPLVAGQSAAIRVESSVAGAKLDYFFDFDANGVFGNAANEVFTATLAAGLQTLTINVPATAIPGTSYARFRISTAGGLGPTGAATDGEVEDYAVVLYAATPPLDFGDAPSTYGTAAGSGGAMHATSSLRLGTTVDAEANGVASGTSTSDGVDEDGVRFTQLFVPGTAPTITVTASNLGTQANLDCFFDFNASGTFGDQPNEIFRFLMLAPTAILPIAVPPETVVGITAARFRLSTGGQLSPNGFASDGEVEDYQVRIINPTVITTFENFDSVTAPALPTGWTRTSTVSGGVAVNWNTVNSGSDTLPNNAFVAGASYISTNRLTSAPFVVTEANQQIRFRQAYDHEYTYDGGVLEVSTNGTTFTDFVAAGGTFVSGGYTTLLNTGATIGSRNAWSAGSEDYYETIANLPASMLGQTVYLRWTEGTDSSTSNVGWSVDSIRFARTALAFDYGDSPTPYPTSSGQLGAAHARETTLRLGANFDTETNAATNATATADDSGATDDEDGVTFVGNIQQFGTGSVNVVASAAGLLSAWIDFNDDGDWADDGEQIFRDQLLAAGTNNLTYAVGAGAIATAQTFARFRLSSQAGLWYSGQAADGEVEDYQVAIIAGTPPSFLVAGTTPTSTGVVLDFNRDFDPTTLNLYDADGSLGPADVTLVGATVGNVRGSLVIGANLRRATFVATTGRLQPDSYTLTLRSAPNGFRDATTELLDGNADGTAGGDYSTTFSVTAPAAGAVTISLPNVPRGPQQAVNVPATTTGLPISFSDGGGITSATLNLKYDPALLTISGGTVAAGLPAGASVAVNTSVAGVATIQFTSPTPLTTGTTRFVDLQASVPATAPYRSKQILDLDSILINAGAIPALDDDAVQVVAYFGDLTGNGTYSGSDSTRLSRLVVGLEPGVAAYKLLDPAIIADITGAAGISSSDVTRVMQRSAGFTVAEIPALPSPAVSLLSGGPDPHLSIPRNLVARAGEELAVPVLIDSIVDLTGNGLESADLVIYFDPDVLDVREVRLGSLLTSQPTSQLSGWIISSRIDPLAGRIDVALGGYEPLEGLFQGELVQLHAVVKADAAEGPTAINLAASSRDPSRFTLLNEGYLTLIPAPTNAADDPVDGLVTVVAAESAADRPTANWESGELRITGLAVGDRILVGPVGVNQVRVRIGDQLLGPFAVPQSLIVTGRTSTDAVVSSPELSGIRTTYHQEVQDRAILQLLALEEASNPDFLDASAGRRRR